MYILFQHLYNWMVDARTSSWPSTCAHMHMIAYAYDCMLNDTSGAKRLHSLNMSASCRVRLWDNWDEHQLMRSERGTGAHAPEESLHGHASLLPYVGKVTEVNPKLANPHTIWILLTGLWLGLPLWKIWSIIHNIWKNVPNHQPVDHKTFGEV